MRPLCPGTCTRAPGQRSDRPFSVTSPPSKTEVVADRFRHPFRGATHVPTSAPEGQRSAATFNFEGTSGGVERREKGNAPALPRKVHEGPRTEERRALLCHLPPRKPKSWRIDSDTRSEERHTSPPRPQKGSALPRLSISRERAGESRGVRRASAPFSPGRCTRAPGQRSDRPFSVTSPLENRSRGGSIPTPVPRSDTCPHLGPRRAALCRDFQFRGNDRGSREA